MFQSTHPQRVRLIYFWMPDTMKMFQSTHPQRVRQAVHGYRHCPPRCFNPRTHKGCDMVAVDWLCLTRKFQSTHPQRVRLSQMSAMMNVNPFQSTHPQRVRPLQCFGIFSSIPFQSTHPQRVRLAISPLSTIGGCFNPRTHKGCDMVLAYFLISKQRVSIHAPTKGATASAVNVTRSVRSFNPRTHKGCDLKSMVTDYAIPVSIHAPTKGATFVACF